MVRLADDIEEYLLTGQQDRAIQTLSQRRSISLQCAGEQVSIRMLEILVELHSEVQYRRARLLRRLAGADGQPKASGQ